MLKSDHSSITDIAYSLGYNNVYEFSRNFKNHTGKSPLMYAKQQGEEDRISKSHRSWLRWLFCICYFRHAKISQLAKSSVAKSAPFAPCTESVLIPARVPASIPASASSTIMQSPGAIFSISAAFKNTSGSGLECVILLPSETASKYLSSPICSKIIGVFLLDEPIAIFMSFFFSF